MENTKSFNDTLQENGRSKKKHVAVIVLGDVGRSPRMQYHARSLLQNNCEVTLIGYEGEDLIPDLVSETKNPSFRIIRFSPTKANSNHQNKYISFMSRIPILGKVLYYVMRLIALVGGVHLALWVQMERVPDCILVQNPPSIPLLLLTYIYCHTHTIIGMDSKDGSPKTGKTRPGLVIDWHNLGYTMFGYSSPYHPIKIIAKVYERLLGPKADAHLCVTKAMKDFLLENNFITSLSTHENAKNVNVLHDRPPEFFHQCQPSEIHDVISRYQKDFKDCFPNMMTNDSIQNESYGEGLEIVESTLFTVKLEKKVGFLENLMHGSSNDDDRFEYHMRHNRPALVVSSTSWTPDEDFSILLDALLLLEERIRLKKQEQKMFDCSKIVVVVTGKGPQKESYQEQIKTLNPSFSNISIQTLWLSASDYPLFIGSANLGVSLHTSTSGIDLPMKILDNLGCNVPVCAISFKCVQELVVDNINGKVFHNHKELAETFLNIFGDDGDNTNNWREGKGLISQWRDGIGHMKRWKENWNSEARHIIYSACDISADTQDHIKFWVMNARVLILSIMVAIGLYLFR